MKSLVFIFTVFFFLSFFITPSLASEPEGNNSVILQGVISGALNKWVQGIGDDLVSDSRVVVQGNNSTDTNTGIFYSITAPIEFASNEIVKDKASSDFILIVLIAKIIVSFSALWCLINIKFPQKAAEITRFLYGHATYYMPTEILITVRNLALWFMCGPGLIILMFVSCNKIIENMDTSALDQAVISSENLFNYLLFGITAKFVSIYMTMRAILFLEVARYWWVFGVIFAIRSTRWIGVLFLEYLAIQVYVQPVIVAVMNNTVSFMLSGGFGIFGLDMSIYGCLSLLLFCICFVAATAPIWIAIFSPGTLNVIIWSAKAI